MLMHGGVARAFGGAGAAEGDASGELGFLQLAVSGLVGAGHDVSRRGTDRGTIEVETNAADQLVDMLFGETSVGASRASFNAGKTRIDAAADRIGLADMLRMGMEQGADRGHRKFLYFSNADVLEFNPNTGDWFLARIWNRH